MHFFLFRLQLKRGLKKNLKNKPDQSTREHDMTYVLSQASETDSRHCLFTPTVHTFKTEGLSVELLYITDGQDHISHGLGRSKGLSTLEGGQIHQWKRLWWVKEYKLRSSSNVSWLPVCLYLHIQRYDGWGCHGYLRYLYGEDFTQVITEAIKHTNLWPFATSLALVKKLATLPVHLSLPTHIGNLTPWVPATKNLQNKSMVKYPK